MIARTKICLTDYANIANEMIEAGYKSKEIQRIKKDVQHYNDIRKEVMISVGDDIDLKAYELAMRHLIDNYIDAEDSRQISAFEDMTLVELLVNKGVSAIDKLSENIKKNKEAIEYEKYLQEIVNIAKDSYKHKSSSYKYPEEIDTDERIALYNDLNQNKDLAIAIDETLKKKTRWLELL